ncbi:caspase-8 isoform X2 [Neoarius graeffei]|uniref:caspase-8 isoform X2 n=1 Tax=Neoarius graeffei TaxID=443677 RepID=UPI00298D08E1|nr:caspase-8 isoform X2 [Neoarius graeffei]
MCQEGVADSEVWCFRVQMLYKLSEDVTDDNLHDIKFLLSNLPKAKLTSATFLDVLAEMEKMELLGEDNLDKLEDVLSNCSKELADKVQKFKNSVGSRELDRMSISDQEESTSLAVPCQEESTNLSVPCQEESTSLPVPRQEAPIGPSDLMQDIPMAETGTSSHSVSMRPRSENTVYTDSQGEPVPEMSQTNAINVEDYYPVTQRPLGHCLIINNFAFQKTSMLLNRNGTDTDKDALTEVFKRMHFTVQERRDLSSTDMLNTVMEFSKKDHSKMDAFVCCVLSHGEKGTVFGTDGKHVQIRDLTQPFAHCTTLTGKPKLFFIQACQGGEMQLGVWRQDGTEEEEYEHDAEKADFRSVPIEADFLIGMATVESYKSFRHTRTGSIFIQELCKHLQIGCPIKEDILAILTKVNRSVSDKIIFSKFKQMPEPRYTLTKKLVLPMD